MVLQWCIREEYKKSNINLNEKMPNISWSMQLNNWEKAYKKQNNWDECGFEFIQKLKSCEQFACEFVHPLTQWVMKKKIMWMSGELCLYNEEMPNQMYMECLMTLNQSEVMSEVYLNTFSWWINSKNSISWDRIESKYLLNWNWVDNPLQDFIEKWVCKIIIPDK
jgi:hypothetical protein